MFMTGEMCKEQVVAYFEVLSRYALERTKRNYEERRSEYPATRMSDCKVTCCDKYPVTEEVLCCHI
jgi:hypothetical protein